MNPNLTDDPMNGAMLHSRIGSVDSPFQHSGVRPSLRKRLGIGPKNRGAASRIIRQTIEEGLVKLYDESAGKKHMRYVPYWA